MFHLTNNLKNIIVILDGFNNNGPDEWDNVASAVNAIFLTSDANVHQEFSQHFPGKSRLGKKIFLEFIPQHSILKVVDDYQFLPDNTAIVFANPTLPRTGNAAYFGSILISQSTTFPRDYASNLPDYIIKNIDDILTIQSNKNIGFASEILSCNNISIPQGTSLPFCRTTISVDEKECLIATGGRYYKSNSPQNSFHQLSNRIVKSKENFEQEKFLFNNFFVLLSRYLHSTNPLFGITFVPCRPDKADRFKLFASELANSIGVTNIHPYFHCDNYENHKSLSAIAREENVSGKFHCSAQLDGHILIIDDVLTSGATTKECARVAFQAGAKQVTIAVLAINQEINWPDNMLLACPRCNSPMHIRFNGRSRMPFFGCRSYPHCKHTEYYQTGISIIRQTASSFLAKAEHKSDVAF